MASTQAPSYNNDIMSWATCKRVVLFGMKNSYAFIVIEVAGAHHPSCLVEIGSHVQTQEWFDSRSNCCHLISMLAYGTCLPIR